ncbi:hypothetical protein ACIOWF_05160 [Cellulosimicrobium cellulans]|uniref:hypothetical protein n=1 Tax=Cellulosimicrobium cellulans TaxID=1710 RepID=UPI0037FB61FD
MEPNEPERPDESTPDLGGFDPVAAAREHWDAPSRRVYPDLIHRTDVLFGALTGGDANEEAMNILRQRAKRAGWTHTISPTGKWTPVRR